MTAPGVGMPASASTATVDLGAIAANVSGLVRHVAPAQVCAVVKADAYGHGAIAVAETAVSSGATWLAVANVTEAAVLRAADIQSRMLVLSEPATDRATVDRLLALGCDVVVYQRSFIELLASRAEALGVPEVAVHLKVDTGMRRVGIEPDEAVSVARLVERSPSLRLAGTMTHLARADEPDDPCTEDQLARFDEVLAALAAAEIDPGVRHAANSAGVLAHRRSHHDLVRVGIAVYGEPPVPADGVGLRPALRWHSTIRFIKRVPAGQGLSYGHHHRTAADAVIATVPVGYADGLARRTGFVLADVLVGGRRCPIVGAVTMDQCLVDVTHVEGVSVGDEVVLMGEQDGERISADEVAGRLDTISYEVLCAIGARVARDHVRKESTS